MIIRRNTLIERNISSVLFASTGMLSLSLTSSYIFTTQKSDFSTSKVLCINPLDGDNKRKRDDEGESDSANSPKRQRIEDDNVTSNVPEINDSAIVNDTSVSPSALNNEESNPNIVTQNEADNDSEEQSTSSNSPIPN